MRTKARKLIWSAPLVAVFAVVGALAIFVALQPNPAAAQEITATGKDLPGMVQNLKVEPHVEAEGGTPQEQLKISWDPPAYGGAVVSYRIDLSFDNEEWFSYIDDHGDSDLLDIYGDETDVDANEAPLLADITVHFRVFAFNQEGTGPGVGTLGTTSSSERPDPVAGLMAAPDVDEGGMAVCPAGDDLTTIDLKWRAPEDPPGAPVTTYRIEWSSDGGRWFLLQEAILADVLESDPDGADRTYTDTGLLADTTRHYRIYAINSVGRGPVSLNSDVATTGTSTVPELPGAIEYILLSPQGTEVHLKWTEPANPCGDPVSGYQFQARLSDIGGDADNAGDPDGTPDPDSTNVDTTGDGDADTDPADLWRNLHTGNHTDDGLGGEYTFGGDDISHDGFVYQAGDPLNIRIKTINRTGEAGSATDTDDDDWLTINHVPVGDANLPRRQGNPKVEQDRIQNEGRTGLNVSWPAATFHEGQSPADEEPDGSTHILNVRYVLAIGEEEEEDAASQRFGTNIDDTEATGEIRAHVGPDFSRQMTNDDALQAEDTRSYRVYPIRAIADLLPTTVGWEFAILGQTVVIDVIRGLPSKVVSGSTARPLPPGIPVNLAATAGGHTEIDLSWRAPVEDPDNPCSAESTDGFVRLGTAGQAAAPTADFEEDGSECGVSVLTGYRVDISETGTSGWEILATVAADPVTEIIPAVHTAEDLIPAKRYYFRVAAVNSRGAGDNTNHVSTDTDTADPPTPPGGLVVQAVSTSQLTMCWFGHNLVDPLTGDAILDEGLPVLGYQITYLGADDVEVMLVRHTMSTSTVFDDPSTLPAGTSRTYRVRSINLGNVLLVGGDDITLGGTQYSEAEANTLQAAPSGLNATADSDTAITLTWDAGGDAIHGYEVERKSGDGDFMPVDPAHSGTDAMYADTGLTRGTEYTYRVRSVMSTVPSTWSDEKSAATHDVPDAPTVTAAATSDTEITVSWTAADNGSAIIGYMVERKSGDGEFTAVDPAHTGTATTYMDTALTPETTYYYRVAAINAIDAGDYSDGMTSAMTYRTNTAPTTVGTIADVTLEASQTSAMDVAGYFNDADMGDTLTYTAMSNMEMYATADIPADSSMLTITGVAAGSATVTVTATDMDGATAMQEIMVTVEAAEPAEPEEVGPATGVTTGPFNEGGVMQVNWDAAPNATGYIIYVVNVDELDAADGQIVIAAVNDATAETYTLSGLNSGDTYDIYVVATAKEMVAWPADADVVQVEAE